MTQQIFIPGKGLVIFNEDGTATLEGDQLTPDSIQELKNIIGEYTEVAATCDISRFKQSGNKEKPGWTDYYYPGIGHIRMQNLPPAFYSRAPAEPPKTLMDGKLVAFDYSNMTMEQFPNEGSLQAACFQWSWNHYPEYRYLFFKVHNEGKKSKARATMDKGMGIVPGEPDIVWVKPLFGVEIKMPGEEQTPDQKKVERVWTENGVKYYLAESIAEYRAIIICEVGYPPRVKNTMLL